MVLTGEFYARAERPCIRDARMPDAAPGKKGNAAVAMAGIGSEMVGFTLGGILIDYLIGSLPMFTVIFTLAGMTLAMWHLSKWAKARSRS